MTYLEALRQQLGHLLASDERVVLLGADIADPYGGAFKVTRGLSEAHPERVRTTPVSEAAMVGMAGGLALAGYRPVVEIMFGDFITLTLDQILNHISKYPLMYNGRADCPVVIRTPSGGGRGYGATHSQSLEKHFLGIPNLRVAAASPYHDVAETWSTLLADALPTLHIEHKMLYPTRMKLPRDGMVGNNLAEVFRGASGCLPTVSLSAVPRADCRLSLLAYGYQAMVAEQVIERLAVEEELFVELLVPGQIAPMVWQPVLESVEQTGALVCVEEGTAGWSWGTEIAAVVGARCFGRLRRPVVVATSKATAIPSAIHLERQVLLGADRIERAIREAAQ